MSYTVIEIYCTGRKDTHDKAPVEQFAKTGPAEWVPLRELTHGGRGRLPLNRRSGVVRDGPAGEA
jgi:hypothetical protein